MLINFDTAMHCVTDNKAEDRMQSVRKRLSWVIPSITAWKVILLIAVQFSSVSYTNFNSTNYWKMNPN